MNSSLPPQWSHPSTCSVIDSSWGKAHTWRRKVDLTFLPLMSTQKTLIKLGIKNVAQRRPHQVLHTDLISSFISPRKCNFLTKYIFLISKIGKMPSEACDGGWERSALDFISSWPCPLPSAVLPDWNHDVNPSDSCRAPAWYFWWQHTLSSAYFNSCPRCLWNCVTVGLWSVLIIPTTFERLIRMLLPRFVNTVTYWNCLPNSRHLQTYNNYILVDKLVGGKSVTRRMTEERESPYTSSGFPLY